MRVWLLLLYPCRVEHLCGCHWHLLADVLCLPDGWPTHVCHCLGMQWWWCGIPVWHRVACIHCRLHLLAPMQRMAWCIAGVGTTMANLTYPQHCWVYPSHAGRCCSSCMHHLFAACIRLHHGHAEAIHMQHDTY